MPSLLRQLASLARVAVSAAASAASTEAQRETARSRTRTSPAPSRTPSPVPTRSSPSRTSPNPQSPSPRYAPHADGDADPGEVVWTWVPFEEDPAQGKDRPVLVVRVDGERLVALMLTSKDHDRDAAEQARHGHQWMDVGTGAWDRERRPSEVRLDRVLHLDAKAVRREGAALDRATFERVVAAAGRLHGWD